MIVPGAYAESLFGVKEILTRIIGDEVTSL
jgi:hypothetical protein